MSELFPSGFVAGERVWWRGERSPSCAVEVLGDEVFKATRYVNVRLPSGVTSLVLPSTLQRERPSARATLFGPRRVLVRQRADVEAAIRAAGHIVEGGPLPEAFERADAAVVVAPPSSSGFFYAGAARAKNKPLLALREEGTDLGAITDVATAIASTVDELVDLLGRWDPVARTFARHPGDPLPVVHYRHRDTGEVRELRHCNHAILPALDLIGADDTILTVRPGLGLEDWERVS